MAAMPTSCQTRTHPECSDRPPSGVSASRARHFRGNTMNRFRNFVAVVWLLASLCASRAALADQTFCIDPGHQPTNLFDALVTWRDAVNEQVTIKVVGGTYGIGVQLTQLHDPPASLMLLGGYAPN